MSRSTTLVVIGYHSVELDWGKKIRKYYLEKKLQSVRNIHWLEIPNSPMPSGFDNDECDNQIIKFTRESRIEDDLGAIVDVHCMTQPEYPPDDGFFFEFFGLTPKQERRLVNRSRYMTDENYTPSDFSFKGKKILSQLKNPAPYIVIEYIMAPNTYDKRKEFYWRGIREAGHVINSIHDILTGI